MTDDVAVSTEIQVDDETRAALLLFNERVEATAAQERGAKRVAKAERAKDEAAAVVRKLNENPDASAEAKSEAEAVYKAALDSYNSIKDDPAAREPSKKPKAEAPTESATEPAAEPAADAPTETSADEEVTAAVETASESE
jgi:hypothetical protein